MKAISFRQPWAFAVLHLGKDLENRGEGSWAVRKFLATPGQEFLVHASAGVAKRDIFHAECEAIIRVVGLARWEEVLMTTDDCTVFERDRDGLWVPGEGLPRGGVVGQATTTGVFIRPNTLAFDGEPPGMVEWAERNVDKRWHFADQYGYVLDMVETFDFYPCKGRLGVFDVAGPDGVYDQP